MRGRPRRTHCKRGHPLSAEGKRQRCRICYRAWRAARKRAWTERLRAQRRAWRAKNIDHHRAYNREWATANRVRRLRVGGRAMGYAKTAEVAQVIRAHIAQRMSELMQRQREAYKEFVGDQGDREA